MEFVFTLFLFTGLLALFLWIGGVSPGKTWNSAYRVSVIAISLILFLSLLSYQIGVSQNWAGILGKNIATYLSKTFGFTLAYALVLLVFVLGLLGTDSKRSGYRITISLFVALYFLVSLISLWGYRGIWVGSLSTNLSISVQKILGRYGGTIFMLLFAFLFVLMAFPELKLRLRIRLPKFPKKKKITQKQKLKVRVTPPKAVSGGKTISVTGGTPVEPSAATEGTITMVRGEQSDFVDHYDAIPGEDALLPLLNEPIVETEVDMQECEENARLIEEKLKEFKATGRVVAFHPGPVVTRYEFELDPGIKISKVVSLADDLALRMKTSKVRIVAPLPNKGRIGIEVPNRKRKIVYFKELVSHHRFKEIPSKLAFALGVDTAGHPVFADLAKMPHLLIAGATGSGKSVCINGIITSVLFRANPKEVRFILVDPKRIELSYYEGIPHLLLPVVKDRENAVEILRQAVKWMDQRYEHFAKDGVRDIESHNSSTRKRRDKPVPYIVIVIDEFADLILSVGKKVEEPLARLAQMARAVGIYLVVATQRPSVDVITGMIKANFPVRIAFKVTSRVDSRTILDEIGAEKLLGRGDMLFLPPGSSELKRIHGTYISEEETKRITSELAKSYLIKRLSQTFGPRNWEPVVKEIIEDGFLTAITRADEPGADERLHQVAIRYISKVLKIPVEEIVKGLEELRTSYYPPIEEVERPVLTREETFEKLETPEGMDPLLLEAAKLAVTRKTFSATMIQRKLKVGFARAARIIDQLEELGIVGPQEGVKPRRVLMTYDELERKFMKPNNR